VDLGNTVIVVEHNMDVIKTADWVIDLGPEAGDAGGHLVAEGTPEEVAKVTGSHTGAILVDVLAAGPYAERPRYDPAAAEAPRTDDQPLETVGKNARMPWEIEGKRWHTADRLTSEGKRCRWEGRIVEWVDERVHEAGQFADTRWDERTVVEVAALVRSQGWFLHMMTGMEWLVRLVFRVGRNAFKQADLVQRLGIRPLNETPGLEVYGSDERVWVTNHKGPWQSVTILAHRLSEIDTPAFREFLTQAAASFHANLKRMQTKPEDVMPWKVNGQRWHLSDKGFKVGRQVRWSRALLARMVDLVKTVEPALEIVWDARDAIKVRVPGIGRSWAQWRTKDSKGLDCRFLGKKGQLNLGQVESFGIAPHINSTRADSDLLHLVFQHEDHIHAAKLKEILTEHLRGFREAFAGRRAAPERSG
jgi:excinuclease ABC subunit A